MALVENWGVVKWEKFLDVSEYQETPPREKNLTIYDEKGRIKSVVEKGELFNQKVITGVHSSRYGHPKHKDLFYQCKNNLELLLEEKLYPTYYFDRFYFSGSAMEPHVDREACEISVSMNISSNTDYDWPLYFDMDDGAEPKPFTTSPGDALIYRGIDLYHWREKLQGNKKTYHHQIFFHFVRADGHYLEYAFDSKTVI